jgi:hypothetical protein
MAQLDRSVWAAGLAFESHGVLVGIRANTLEVLKGIEQYFPMGWKDRTVPRVHRLYSLIVGGEDRPGVRYYNLLYGDATRMVRSLDLRDMFIGLEHDLEMYVAEQARGRVFVHAGVVEWKGKAIVLPGDTRSGKTTLVAALVRAGARYYSDEYAVIDGHGKVHPYARPLSIRTETGDLRKVSIEQLGGRAGRRPLAVATVLITRYRPGTIWRPYSLSSGKTVMRLLAHTLSARRAPEQALSVLVKVAGEARKLSGIRGEADELASALLSS